MIETIEKIFGILAKPAVFLFRYFTRKPKITLSIKGGGCAQGPGHLAGQVYFRWNRDLILHNDSAHLIRGIKLLSGFPKPWILNREVPTRLEPDQKVAIPFEAHLVEDHQKLMSRYGEHILHRMGDAVFPSVVATVILKFELTNEQGRKVYQYSKFNEDGSIETEISTKQRDNGS